MKAVSTELYSKHFKGAKLIMLPFAAFVVKRAFADHF